MKNLVGCLLICSAALQFCRKEFLARAEEFKLIQELEAALEDIKTAVRWQQLALPDALAEQVKKRIYSGKFFAEVLENMKSEITLQSAWEKVFSGVKTREVSEILCNIEWAGDQTHLLQQLTCAGERLERFYAERRLIQRETGKIQFAAAFSAAGLLMVLLL